MAKFVKFISIFVLILMLTVAFFRDTLCRSSIQMAVTKATGLKLSIKHLNLNILRSSLELQGITLFNPPGFKDQSLAKAKQILIKYDLLDSLRGKLHLKLLRVDISEVNIIRNKENASNVSGFKKTKSEVEPKKEIVQTASQTTLKEVKKDTPTQPKFLIDRLELSLGKVTFIDYQAGIGEPAVIIFTVDSPCVLKNVTDLDHVINSVSVKGGFKNVLTNLVAKFSPKVLKTTTEAIKESIPVKTMKKIITGTTEE